MTPWILLLPAAVLLRSLLRISAGLVAQAVDRGEPWRPTRRALAVLGREVVLDGVLTVLAWVTWERAPRRQAAGAAPPVLLVGGSTKGPASLGFLATYLRHRGRAVHIARRASSDADLPERADQLARELEALLAATRAPRADVVAHGAGGIVAAFLLAHDPSRARQVHRLVTVGTPWRGTRMAIFLHGPLSRELLPGSPALDHLLPPPVPTVSVWAPDDPLLVPAGSGCADDLASIAIEGAGHLGMLASARTFRAVRAALAPDAPTSADGEEARAAPAPEGPALATAGAPA